MPNAPLPEEVDEAEMDALYTFIGDKKTGFTIVDRQTGYFLGWKVVFQRTQQAIQDLVDPRPKSKRYYSDAFDAYYRLGYHTGQNKVSQDKTDTYSVEAGNAELRH
jgi:IS1 family transposase